MIRTVAPRADIIGKASRVTAVLQIFAIILLCGLIYILADISARYSTLQDGIRENALWSVYQLDRETRKLHETLHVMLAVGDTSAESIKQLSTRYDILYSRMTILEEASFGGRFHIDATVSRHIAAIRDGVFGSQHDFDRLAAGGSLSAKRLGEVDMRLEAIGRSTEELLTYTNNMVSSDRADGRDAIMRLQVKSAILVGLLAVCAVFLVASLRRQLKSVRLAGLALEEVSNGFNEAFLAADAGNRAKSQFMATIGHEIRTPLNAILGTAELLELSPLPTAAASGVQTIRRSGEALLEIINEILDYAKLEHGRLEVDARPVDVEKLLRCTVDMMRDRARERGNRIHLVMPTEFSAPVIVTDPTRMRQVLLNLLSNAVKFTSGGSVTLKVSETEAAGEERLRFDVVDTGIGIDEEGLQKLFRPFSQVDLSISREYGGTGLGLTICKQIVEALGGSVGVESRPGVGSVFWFEIPRVPGAITSTTDVSASQLEDTLPALDILLVEDNLVNQQVAAGLLAHLGQKVTLAANGREGVEAVRNGRFDLVLMDMQMPVMDGIEATLMIRALGSAFAKLPIIAMTANASADDERLCHEAGMSGFEAKPMSSAQLRRIVAGAGKRLPVQLSQSPANGTDASFEVRKAEIVDAIGAEGFEEIVALFFQDATALLDQLAKARLDRDMQTADRSLHTLKGAASSIGLQDVADLSQKLRHGDISSDMFGELENTISNHRHRLAA